VSAGAFYFRQSQTAATGYWHLSCSKPGVAALVFLAMGVICALVGRILLLSAAFQVSVWWGIGVLLPFGPLLFRLSYPGVAPLSLKFRLATLPCVLMYLVLQPNVISKLHGDKILKSAQAPAAPADQYGLEPKRKIDIKNLEARRKANTREMERLRAWAEKLRLQKRDLLHSDAEGNLVYNIELTKYNQAVDQAVSEQKALWP